MHVAIAFEFENERVAPLGAESKIIILWATDCFDTAHDLMRSDNQRSSFRTTDAQTYYYVTIISKFYDHRGDNWTATQWGAKPIMVGVS